MEFKNLELPKVKKEAKKIEKPTLKDKAHNLMSRVGQKIAGRLYKELAKFRMKKAEEKLADPILKRFTTDEFGILESMVKFGFGGLAAEDCQTYIRKAKKLRKDIRKETVKSYLNLRKARAETITPKEKEELRKLFARQAEMMNLMNSPEYREHLGRLKGDLKEDIDWCKNELKKISPEARIKELVKQNLMLEPKKQLSSNQLNFLAGIEANIRADDLNKQIERYENFLKSIEVFEKTLKEEK